MGLDPTRLKGLIGAAKILAAVIAVKESIEFVADSIETPREQIERLENSANAAATRLTEAKEAYSTLMS